MITLAIIILFVLATSNFLSLSEASVTSLSTMKASVLRKQYPGSKAAEALEVVVRDKNRYLSTIIILNTLVNVGGSSLIGAVSGAVLSSVWVGVLSVGFTLCILYGAEMAPKLYAAQNPERVGLWVARPLKLLSVMITPMLWLSRWICRPFVGNTKTSVITLTELKYVMKAAEEEGVIQREDTDLIRNIFSVSEKTVSDIMVYANGVETLPIDGCINDYRDQIAACVHRRIIVENPNGVPVGVVKKVDLLQALVRGEGDRGIASLMKPVLIESPDTLITRLMKDLDGVSYHMALIQDAKGHTLGTVAMEDVLHVMVKGFSERANINQEAVIKKAA
jgi:CBS domain containing-hemolysin-like protein